MNGTPDPYLLAKNYLEETTPANAAQVENKFAEIYGLENNPKRIGIWRIAWEREHSGGFLEILHLYDDLVPLIKSEEK